jgi:hypothetical protein
MPESQSTVARIVETYEHATSCVLLQGPDTVPRDPDLEESGAAPSAMQRVVADEHKDCRRRISQFLQANSSAEARDAFMRQLKSQLRRNMAGKRGTEREEYAGEWYTACREALNADLAQWDGRHSKRPQLKGWIVDTFGRGEKQIGVLGGSLEPPGPLLEPPRAWVSSYAPPYRVYGVF